MQKVGIIVIVLPLSLLIIVTISPSLSQAYYSSILGREDTNQKKNAWFYTLILMLKVPNALVTSGI